MDHRKLLLTRVLWADPYKTIYHFKAYRLQNSIIFFFYHNYHKDHNWGDRENYSCVFNTFVRACILLFRQTMFGKWISNYCAKKTLWLIVDWSLLQELWAFQVWVGNFHSWPLHSSSYLKKCFKNQHSAIRFFSSTFDTTPCQLNCVTHGNPFSSFDWLEKEKTQYLIYFHSLWRHNKAIEWSDFFLNVLFLEQL